ncbi:MAG: carbamate kinase [Methanomassiliicoccales archaeon]
METAVVAIGGNAILRAGEEASVENQMNNLRITCSSLARIIKKGYNLTITHGNGPQIGNILLQNELMRDDVPPMPIDVCVAESQGLLGYLIQQALTEALKKESIDKTVVTILTRVLVDSNDDAFLTPTKPIGPFYSEEEAEELRRIKGWMFVEDIKRGGYRRVVPSPYPISIIESDAIKRTILGDGTKRNIVIAAGGGGIPVMQKGHGLVGVEAVVDKDYAASVLARELGEELLIFVTDVDHVYLDFGKPHSQAIGEISLREMEAYLKEGQFPSGTMGPKIEAAIDFLKGGGRRVIITSPYLLERALDNKIGTRIYR